MFVPKRHIGLDLGVKSKSTVFIIDQEGRKTGPGFSIEPTPEELEVMIERALKDAPANTLVDIIMEPTNTAWLPVTSYLRYNHPQIKIYRVKSEKVHDLRRYYNKHTKTDAIDSKTLAKMPVVDAESLTEVYLPNKEVMALNQRCKQRDRMVKELSSKKNSICDQINLGFPGLSDCFSSRFTQPFIAFCEQYANPYKVVRLGQERLTEKLRQLGFRGTVSHLAERIYSKALTATRLYPREAKVLDHEDLQEQTKIELSIFKYRQKQVEKVEERIEHFYHLVHPSDNLRTIAGIGEHIAPVIAGVVGEPKRFAKTSSFQGFTGFVPKKDESGGRDKKGLPMTKAGPNLLKGNMYLATDIARHYDPQIGKYYYEQMVNKGNPHTKAVCACTNRMVARVIAIMREDRPYVFYDLEGRPITKAEGFRIVKEHFTVPEEVRIRLSNRKRPRQRKSGKNKPQNVRGSHKAPQTMVNLPA